MTTSAPTRIYSAPRRFDLATLLVVVLAYCVLFTLMRLLRWGPGAAVLMGVFVTLVGLAQAVLFRGDAPRLASLLTGALFWPVFAITLGVVYGWSGDVFGAILWSGFWGPICGYFAGVLVGGVFLVAEALRRGGRFLGSAQE